MAHVGQELGLEPRGLLRLQLCPFEFFGADAHAFFQVVPFGDHFRAGVFELPCHAVERRGEFADLVLAAIGNVNRQITVGDAAGRIDEFAKRPRDDACETDAQDDAEEQQRRT